jgi:O-methyltransferase involved in polyketide biosynthesis
MFELNSVSETLYIPLLGRIYASRYHPDILYDKAALSLSEMLPENIKEMPGQSEYTSLASAVRSKNTDYYIQAFLAENPDGIIINVGCGLETTYARNDNKSALWFELDLPEVLHLRQKYLPESGHDRYLPYSMFDYKWIDIVKDAAQKPVMVIASGLFYYFNETQVIDFIKRLATFEDIQLVFDAVSSTGMKCTKHYMKKMNKEDAKMYFHVNAAEDLASMISPITTAMEERKFYSLVSFHFKMHLATKFKMFFSDVFGMVKMIHLKIR